jgi:hypothetical protein
MAVAKASAWVRPTRTTRPSASVFVQTHSDPGGLASLRPAVLAQVGLLEVLARGLRLGNLT